MTTEAEQHLAYHGPVRIASWEEKSSSGFRFRLELLDGREALSHFEKATRRRGKKAGQRYHCTWQDDHGELLPTLPSELWFCGANWSHQAGATITLTVGSEDDVERIKCRPSADVDEQAPTMYLGLVQLDDDDQPVNQAKAGLVDWAEGLKGGPKSKAAARRCQEPEFQVFVGQRLRLGRPATAAQCDEWIKRQCGIHTKRLLDYDDPRTGEPFWGKYQRWVQTPFITWLESRAPQAVAS